MNEATLHKHSPFLFHSVWKIYIVRDDSLVTVLAPPPAYLGRLVRLLNGVADDLAVAVVLGRLPLQRGVEAPDVRHVHSDGGAGLFWGRGETARGGSLTNSFSKTR